MADPLAAAGSWRDRARRISVVAAFAFLGAVYLFAQWRDLGRGPHVDEAEHLHVAVLMARGERVYVDFSEHHPPLFWAMLRPLVPHGESVAAMQDFVVRGRLLSGTITALAIFAAAFVVWRASANAWTVVMFVGFLFAAGGVWRNGLGDIRPDPIALGFWWTGAALVLLARWPSLRGLGLGLVILASLVKPQWPLSSLVIGVVFLVDVARQRRASFRATAVAIAVAAAGVAATALLADLRMVYFQVFTLTSAMVSQFFSPELSTRPPFFGCPPMLRPPVILLAALLVGVARARARHAFAAPRLVAMLLLLAGTSLAEIFFVYPYPDVDFRFYAFWVFPAAALLALLPQSAAALFPARTALLRAVREAIPAVAVVLALLASLDLIDPARALPDPYWQSTAWIESHLGPGDTVWYAWPRSPIATRDASYYWFGMNNVIPAALKLAATETGRRYLPPLTEEDLPPCRVERGLDTHVRFLADPTEKLPVANACLTRLRESGRVVWTPYSHLWLVRR
jgi:hypothetical protein